MIQLTPLTKIFISLDATDFRCGIDRLSAYCRKIFDQDPKSGALFVFRNRNTTAVKILFYDSTGFWLFHKRLSRGQFRGWPRTVGEAAKMSARELSVLLWDGDPSGVFRQPWKQIGP